MSQISGAFVIFCLSSEKTQMKEPRLYKNSSFSSETTEMSEASTSTAPDFVQYPSENSERPPSGRISPDFLFSDSCSDQTSGIEDDQESIILEEHHPKKSSTELFEKFSKFCEHCIDLKPCEYVHVDKYRKLAETVAKHEKKLRWMIDFAMDTFILCVKYESVRGSNEKSTRFLSEAERMLKDGASFDELFGSIFKNSSILEHGRNVWCHLPASCNTNSTQNAPSSSEEVTPDVNLMNTSNFSQLKEAADKQNIELEVRKRLMNPDSEDGKKRPLQEERAEIKKVESSADLATAPGQSSLIKDSHPFSKSIPVENDLLIEVEAEIKKDESSADFAKTLRSSGAEARKTIPANASPQKESSDDVKKKEDKQKSTLPSSNSTAAVTSFTPQEDDFYKESTYTDLSRSYLTTTTLTSLPSGISTVPFMDQLYNESDEALNTMYLNNKIASLSPLKFDGMTDQSVLDFLGTSKASEYGVEGTSKDCAPQIIELESSSESETSKNGMEMLPKRIRKVGQKRSSGRKKAATNTKRSQTTIPTMKEDSNRRATTTAIAPRNKEIAGKTTQKSKTSNTSPVCTKRRSNDEISSRNEKRVKPEEWPEAYIPSKKSVRDLSTEDKKDDLTRAATTEVRQGNNTRASSIDSLISHGSGTRRSTRMTVFFLGEKNIKVPYKKVPYSNSKRRVQ